MDDLGVASITASVLLVGSLLAAAVLLVLAVVFFVLWRRAAGRARRATGKAEAVAETAADAVAVVSDRRDRIAHDTLVVTATALTSVIERTESVAITVEQDPASAARAARALADELRVVRDDVRRVVDLVRPPDEPESSEDAAAVDPELLAVAPLVPTDGAVTTSMIQLVVKARDAGLRVHVHTVGEPFSVPGSFAVAAMRIVELALQNAAEHGGAGASATVTATWTDDALRITIEDDGVRAAAVRDGRDPNAVAPAADADRLAMLTGVDGPSISEMRDRASAFGGVFSAGPVPGIGFTVSATFPGIRRAAIASDGQVGG